MTTAHPSSQPQRLPAWPAYVALAAVLAAIAGFGGVYSYIWVPVDLVLFTALAIWLVMTALADRSWPWHPLLVPMAAFGLLVVLQWHLRLSIYPGATLTGLIQLAGCGCLFYLALAGLSSGCSLRLAWILWLFCGALSIEAILQAVSSYPGYVYGIFRKNWASPVGPFIYHNHFAGCMDLLLPLAVAVAFRPSAGREGRWSRWLRRGVVPALGLAALVLSESRGGMLTIGLELLAAGTIFWPEVKRNIWGLLLVLGVCCLFVVSTQWHALLRRFEMLNVHAPSFSERIWVAATCWRIFLHFPWLGTGFNTFATIYPSFQTFDTGQIWLFAHNEYAQMLVETGLAGALCVAAFLLLLLHAGWRRWRRRGHGDPAVRNLQLAAFIGLAGFLFHSYGDFQFHNPANALLFFLVVALAVTPAEKPRLRSANSPPRTSAQNKVSVLPFHTAQ